jgi:hypothetical protein|tara:strand:- start:287 stop:406 length:120 start_codon:yes stop_codon:yes gene_type:complete
MVYGNGGGKKSKTKCRKGADGKMICTPKTPKKSKRGIYK